MNRLSVCFGFNRLFMAKQLLQVDSHILGLSPPPLLSDTSPGVWNGCMTSWYMERKRVLDLLSQSLWRPWFLKQFSFFVFLIAGNLVGYCPWSLHAMKCWSNLLVQLWLSSTSTKNCLIWAPIGSKDLSESHPCPWTILVQAETQFLWNGRYYHVYMSTHGKLGRWIECKLPTS